MYISVEKLNHNILSKTTNIEVICPLLPCGSKVNLLNPLNPTIYDDQFVFIEFVHLVTLIYLLRFQFYILFLFFKFVF